MQVVCCHHPLHRRLSIAVDNCFYPPRCLVFTEPYAPRPELSVPSLYGTRRADGLPPDVLSAHARQNVLCRNNWTAKTSLNGRKTLIILFDFTRIPNKYTHLHIYTHTRTHTLTHKHIHKHTHTPTRTHLRCLASKEPLPLPCSSFTEVGYMYV